MSKAYLKYQAGVLKKDFHWKIINNVLSWLSYDAILIYYS